MEQKGANLHNDVNKSYLWAEKPCGNMRGFKHIHTNTSSTAQGSGGSFKNRKPIGEVGCCESRMAERIHSLMDRKVVEVVFFGVVAMVAVVTSPKLFDVVWCGAVVVVVVVWCNGVVVVSCSSTVMYLRSVVAVEVAVVVLVRCN